MAPRAGLDRVTVVRAAAELADAGGGCQVTLANLAARLGVRTPSLYNHVAGQEGLRRELAVLGARELAARLGRAAIGKSADAAICAMARAYRAFAKERPGLYAAALRAPNPDDTEHQAVADKSLEVLRAVLEAYGLRADDAVHAIRGLRSLLHGFVSLEQVGGFGIPLDVEESFDRLVGLYLSGLREQTAKRRHD